MEQEILRDVIKKLECLSASKRIRHLLHGFFFFNFTPVPGLQMYLIRPLNSKNISQENHQKIEHSKRF